MSTIYQYHIEAANDADLQAAHSLLGKLLNTGSVKSDPKGGLAFKGSIAYGHIWDEDILPLKGSSVIIAEQCCDRRLIRCDTMKETCEEWEPSISEPVGKLLDAQKWEPSLKPLLALPDWRKLGACEDSY